MGPLWCPERQYTLYDHYHINIMHVTRHMLTYQQSLFCSLSHSKIMYDLTSHLILPCSLQMYSFSLYWELHLPMTAWLITAIGVLTF